MPTTDRSAGIADPRSREQVETLARNCAEFGATHFAPDDVRHGITHVIGPERGIVLPGMVAVACDSHAVTYGALGAVGFGIGATDVESVFRSNTLIRETPTTLRITLTGRRLDPGVSAKDVILAVIGKIGADGANGHAIEFAGEAVDAMSMESRLTLCNMSVEAGARAGLVAPDEVTFQWLAGRPYAPSGADWDAAVAFWQTLRTDLDALFDREAALDVSALEPHVTWGTSPEEVLPITGRVPDPAEAPDAERAEQWARALEYMDLKPGMALTDIAIDCVFIGSCTNGRIEDLEAAAEILRGHRIASGVRAMVVPGSARVKVEAEERGLDRIFTEAGFEWRESGCSLCNALNGDELSPFERSASTSNRNFEHRQGRDGRTHLVSPAMAAATALSGRLTDPRESL